MECSLNVRLTKKKKNLTFVNSKNIKIFFYNNENVSKTCYPVEAIISPLLLSGLKISILVELISILKSQ